MKTEQIIAMKLSSVPVATLNEEPLGIEEDMSPRFLELDESVFKFDNPIHAYAQLSRPDTGLMMAQVTIEARQECVCGCCLEIFHRQLKQDMVFTIDLKGRLTIDLIPLIREEIISEQPIRILCTPECRGLCARCGVNLNRETCQCQK